ncbi:hypothetical protein J6590_069262 [Homalodisca vitripennis]|nr:hypothetical protein J6590_069262 [Homalodisca vitripennis]
MKHLLGAENTAVADRSRPFLVMLLVVTISRAVCSSRAKHVDISLFRPNLHRWFLVTSVNGSREAITFDHSYGFRTNSSPFAWTSFPFFTFASFIPRAVFLQCQQSADARQQSVTSFPPATDPLTERGKVSRQITVTASTEPRQQPRRAFLGKRKVMRDRN